MNGDIVSLSRRGMDLSIAEHEKSRLSGEAALLRGEADGLQDRLGKLDRVNIYFNTLVEQSITENRLFIESLINRCLSEVFDGGYAVRILEKKSGVRVIRYLEIMDTVSGISGGKESHGGGVLAVISFLLRFVISYKFRFYPLLILDEPFSFVSKEYRSRLSRFVKELCKQFGYTILVISHEEEISEYADKTVVLYKSGENTLMR
jgi:DNA repair exonuclease SbcCD ATPase subunit